jgi:hypothetical protein
MSRKACYVMQAARLVATRTLFDIYMEITRSQKEKFF